MPRGANTPPLVPGSGRTKDPYLGPDLRYGLIWVSEANLGANLDLFGLV